MRYERKYIQYNDLVFDGYGMLGEYDASNVSFKVTTHPMSFGNGSYAPFKSQNAFVEESSVSLTLWLKEKKLPCDVRPFYRSFVIEQLSKHGKLWAVQDNTLVWAYATVQSYSEMVEHANGKLGIDVDFLLYEGVWHKADKQKTFLHPYDLCAFMDCFNYKEYQPCKDVAYTHCGECEAIDIDPQTKSGSIVEIENENPHDVVDSITMQLQPQQDFNGYDHPWPSGAGKNLLVYAYPSETKNAVTFTVNSDKTISTSGTATANAEHSLTYRVSGTYGTCFLKAGTYILSGCPSGGGSSKYEIGVNTTINGSGVTLAKDYGSGATFTLENDGLVGTWITIRNGQNANGLTFKPMIRLSSVQDDTYEPYENICPITGFDNVHITSAGKNLLNHIYPSQSINGITFTENSDGTVSTSGTATANAEHSLTYRVPGTYGTCFLKAGTYILSGCPSGGGSAKYEIGINTMINGSGVTLAIDYGNGAVFTLNDDGLVGTWISVRNGIIADNLVFKPMIRLASISDDDYEPYNGTTYNISFESAGTVYYGSLEAVSGLLTVTHKEVTFNGTETWASSNGGMRMERSLPDAKPTSSNNVKANAICDRFETVTASQNWNGTIGFAIDTRPYVSFCQFGTQTMNQTDFQAWLSSHPTTVVYELANPVTYQVSVCGVSLTLGNNYIWSDVSDITVTTTGYHRDAYDGCAMTVPTYENDRYCCECDCDQVEKDMALCYHLEDLQDVYKECSNAGFRVVYDCESAERFFNILGQSICTDNCNSGTLAGKIYSETDIPTSGVVITLVGKMHNPYIEINGNGNWIAGDYDGRLRIESNGDVYYENGCCSGEPLEPDIWQKPSDMNYGWTILPRYNRVVINLGACCRKACAYFSIDNLTI